MNSASHSKTYLHHACVLFVAVILLFAAAFLSSCSSVSQEDIIRNGVTAELEQIKGLDDDSIDEMVEETAEDENLAAYGITTKEFTKTWLSGFDYSVDNVTVEGNNAYAEVTLYVKSLPEVFNSWEAMIVEFTNAPETAEMTQEEINKGIGDLFMRALRSAPLKAETVVLPYEHSEDGVWRTGEGFAAILNEAFTE